MTFPDPAQPSQDARTPSLFLDAHHTAHRCSRAVQSPWLRDRSDPSRHFSLPRFRLVYTRLLPKSADRERRQVPHSGGTFPLSPSPQARLPGHVPAPLPWEGRESLSSCTVAQTLPWPAPPPSRPQSSTLIFDLCGQAADCAGQDSPPAGQL